MDAQQDPQQQSGADDGSVHGEDGGDVLRALVDQFEAAERELRATEELRRVHAEQVARLRQEVKASVDAALESCAAERAGLERRLHGLEEREEHLEGIKARVTGDPTPETTSPDDVNASTTTPVAPVSEGWVVSRDPENGEMGTDGNEQRPSEDRSEEGSGSENTPEGTSAEHQQPSAQDDTEGAYEDGWYEVLKQRS